MSQARITRLERELVAEKKKTAKLEKALSRAHFNLETLRADIWGNKLLLNQAKEAFNDSQNKLIRGRW